MEKGVKETLVLKLRKEIEDLKSLEDCIRGVRQELERQVRHYTGQKLMEEVLQDP